MVDSIVFKDHPPLDLNASTTPFETSRIPTAEEKDFIAFLNLIPPKILDSIPHNPTEMAEHLYHNNSFRLQCWVTNLGILMSDKFDKIQVERYLKVFIDKFEWLKTDEEYSRRGLVPPQTGLSDES